MILLEGRTNKNLASSWKIGGPRMPATQQRLNQDESNTGGGWGGGWAQLPPLVSYPALSQSLVERDQI